MGILINFKFFRLFQSLSFSKGFKAKRKKKITPQNLSGIEWDGREKVINLLDDSSDCSVGVSIKRETLPL